MLSVHWPTHSEEAHFCFPPFFLEKVTVSFKELIIVPRDTVHMRFLWLSRACDSPVSTPLISEASILFFSCTKFFTLSESALVAKHIDFLHFKNCF